MLRDEDGSGRYLAMLKIDGEEEAFGHRRMPERGEHARIVESVQAFVDNPEQAMLTVHHGDLKYGLTSGIFFTLFGLILALGFGRTLRMVFDADAQEMTVRRVGPFLWPSTRRIPLSEVVGAEVQVHSNLQNTDGQTSRVAVILADGSRVPLLNAFTSGMGFNEGGIVKEIEEFLQENR